MTPTHNSIDPGVRVTPLSSDQLLAKMEEFIADRHHGHYVIFLEGNLLSRLNNNPDLEQAVRDASFVMPDGIAPALLASWATGRRVTRVPGPQFMPLACEYGLSRGWRHFFYGSTPEVVECVARTLTNAFPSLIVAGVHAPPFRPLTAEEDRLICERIEAMEADVVWVALGGPKQEIWMHEHQGRLGVPIMLGVGAAFDFIGQTQPRAPRVVQHLGCEWLFRMLTGGPRLFRRNLSAAGATLWILAKAYFRHHRYRPKRPDTA